MTCTEIEIAVSYGDISNNAAYIASWLSDCVPTARRCYARQRMRSGIEHRTTLRGITIEHAMQQVRREAVGQILSALPVVDANECVVRHGERDALRRQLPGQPVVAIAVELKPERCPGRDA